MDKKPDPKKIGTFSLLRPDEEETAALPLEEQTFDDLAVELCNSARRYVAILSPCLDSAAFNNPELASAISHLVRQSRQSEVRILVNDVRPLVARGHHLLQLARRMPSALRIRKLADHPDWNGETVVIRDRDAVLFKPAGSEDRAFCEMDARPVAEQYLERFEDLWRYSEEDPDLRALAL